MQHRYVINLISAWWCEAGLLTERPVARKSVAETYKSVATTARNNPTPSLTVDTAGREVELSAQPNHGFNSFGNGFNHSKYQILVLSQGILIPKTVDSVKLDGNP